MNTKLQLEKELNIIPDKETKTRERQIKEIQLEFGYDRENAARLFEYQQLKAKQITFNCLLGGFAAYKVGPIANEAGLSYPLFRKTWMRVPIRLTAFAGAYYVASQMQTRVFPKFSRKFYKNPIGGISAQTYLANHDLISKFRFFESEEAEATSQDLVEDYLDLYTSGPLTKAEMLNRFAEGKPVDPNFAKKFRIKRMGKDKDDIFWSFGKIHGLENIALCTPEDIKATKGDPMALQELIDKVSDAPKPDGPGSFDNALVQAKANLEAYYKAVENFGNGDILKTSDKKKLLALPFYLVKRQELPAPKKGQKEWDLFKDMTGNEWNKYDTLMFDPEEKITEFNYEKFISKHQLKNMDTNSDDFKKFIKVMNFTTKTKYEKHLEAQENFKELMPILASLDSDETEILLHMLKSKGRNLNAFAQNSQNLIDDACSDELKKQLAKISENEAFALKNVYKHKKDTMQWSKKEKMPINQDKVRDLLRYQHIFRNKVDNELGTYTKYQNNVQQENGILTYVNEAAWGDLRALLKDIGISHQSIQFANVGDLVKAKDSVVHGSDRQFENLRNARFTQVDMTDYENVWPSPNEIKGQIPLHHVSLLEPHMPEMWPQTNALIEVGPLETMRLNSTSKTHRENQELRGEEVEEEEEEEDDDDDDDEDEDEEGEGEGEEEEEEEEEEDEEEEGEDLKAIPRDYIAHTNLEDRFFMHNQKLRSKFNDVELDSFMKLLNVKAVPQWEDQTTHHYKVGLHAYEDESQMVDPYFHMIAEVERQHMEKQQTIEFRRGSEIKFVMDPKKRPVFGQN